MNFITTHQFLDILFTRLTTKIKIDDEIDVFGILRFDSDRKIYFIDRPLAFFKSSLESHKSFSSWLWWRNLGQSFKLSFKMVFWGAMTVVGILFTLRSFYNLSNLIK